MDDATTMGPARLAGRRRQVTRDALDASRRLALYEGRYFRCRARTPRPDPGRTARRRDHWALLARSYHADLRHDLAELSRLGLSALAAGIAADVADRLMKGRDEFLASRGLDPALAITLPFADEPGTPPVLLVPGWSRRN